MADITSYGGSNIPERCHSIEEFIIAGKAQNTNYSYTDFSFIQNLNRTYYIVQNILDDYIDDMKKYCIQVTLSDKEKQTYIYNPKLLSYKLYKTTMLYWVILKLNNLCSVYEFNLSKRKILLMKPNDMFRILNMIHNSERRAMKIFNSTHEKDFTIKE